MTACNRCGKELVSKISKKTGRNYMANPDGSLHNFKVGDDNWVCANNRNDVDKLSTPKQDTAQTDNAPGQLTTGSVTVQVSPENVDLIKRFKKLHDDAYLQCYQLAKQHNPKADDRETQIVTNGYLHDFFHFIGSRSYFD